MYAIVGRRIVAFVVLCALIAPCTAGPKLGVLFKDKTPGFWVYAAKGATETAETLNAEIVVRAPPSVLDVSAQARLLTAFAAENVEALIIAPTNPDTVESAVAELGKKGMKIITVDTPLKDGIADVFIGADQEAIAEAAAKIFLTIAQNGEETALLRNNSLDRTVLTREKTLREAVKTRPDLIMHANIFASSSRDTEEDQAMLLLTTYPNTTLIFASATRGTMASIKAVRNKGLVGKVKVVGFGTYLPEEAQQAFTDGILYGWVAQEPKDLGVKAVRSAVDLLAGKPVPPVVRPDFMLVTRENINSPEAKALMNP